MALLDRGIPFTLTTVDATSAHLQAVIGYDAIRRTLIIRDPYQRIHGEFDVDAFLERYAHHGPRGLALVPGNEAVRFDGLELPDTKFYDGFYRLQRALHCHDRRAAQAELDALEQANRGHQLAMFARKELAAYDANLSRQLEATEELLAKYPKAAVLLREKLFALRQLAARTRYLEFLHELATDKTIDPVFARDWAAELAADARALPIARCFVWRALRFRPTEAENVAEFANILWNSGQFEQATEVYRLAASSRDTVENFSRSYFLAARHVRQTDSALTWLQTRRDKFSGQSSQPARLLFWALTNLGRTSEALAALEAALKARPEDGELLLFAADAFARYGDYARSDLLLGAAKGRSAHTAWLRTSAALAGYRCDLRTSLALWRDVLGAEPLAIDAQQATARLIAEVAGRAAALAHLQEMASRFPHHVPLHRLWIEWMRHETAEERAKVIRQTLAIDADDAWTRRELAVCLTEQRRFQEATAEANVATRIDPQNPSSAWTCGHVALAANDYAAAREYCRRALKISIDHTASVSMLLEASDSFEEKRASLAFIRDELTHQVVFGDGLLAYRDAAYTVLEPAELLANLEEARKARPDLWHARSAVTRQLVDMQRTEEALLVAEEAVNRFPLLPRLWYDLALVWSARGDLEEESKALRRALQINPSWGFVSRALADVFARKGERAEEKRILDEAIAASPLDAINHGARANLLWRMEDKEAAVAELETAIRLDPGFDYAWKTLRTWLLDLGDIERGVGLARELTKLRPGEARSWFRLAESLGSGSVEEREAAINRAIELNPRFVEAYDARAEMLADAGRLDEAEAACRPDVFSGQPPKELVGRAIWIQARRGNLSGAIEQMQALLQSWPNYYWGWTMVADWLARERRFKEAVTAAKTMTRLAPGSAVAFGYLADAQRLAGEDREAAVTLQKAFELDPSYAFAGYAIFDAQLKGRDRTAAEKTLALLEMHLPGWRTLACRVRFNCTWPNKQAALHGLRQLCFVPKHRTIAFEEASNAVAHAGWRRNGEKILWEELFKADVNPEVGAQWVRSFTARGAWRLRRRLQRLPHDSELWRKAHCAYLAELGARHKKRYLERLLRREGETFRRNAQCWGQVGYALVTNGMMKKGVEWMRDWREQKEAQSWMLLNATLAFRSQGKDEEAEEISRHALTLAGDNTTRLHQLWLACDEAVSGEFDSARGRLVHLSLRERGTFFEAVYVLTRSILAVQAALPLERKAVFQQQRRDLKQPRFQGSFRSRALRGKAKKGVQTMASTAGVRPFRIGGIRWAGRLGGGGFRPSYLWIGLVLISAISRLFVTDNSQTSPTPVVVPPPRQRHQQSFLPPLPTPAFSLAPLSTIRDLNDPDFGKASIRLDQVPLKAAQRASTPLPRESRPPK